MATHTPGPWDCGTNYFVLSEVPLNKPVRTVMSAQGDVAYVANWHNQTEEIEANARLMAAAPELLEALKRLLAQHLSAGTDYDATAAAKAAIANAEGK